MSSKRVLVALNFRYDETHRLSTCFLMVAGTGLAGALSHRRQNYD